MIHFFFCGPAPYSLVCWFKDFFSYALYNTYILNKRAGTQQKTFCHLRLISGPCSTALASGGSRSRQGGASTRCACPVADTIQ